MSKRQGKHVTGLRIFGLLGLLLSMMATAALPSLSAQSAGKTTVYPGVVSVACVDGTATVSVPSDTTTDGIFYVITQPDAAGSYKVTAQVGDSYLMASNPGNGWTATNAWNAVYTGVAPDCSGPTLQTGSQLDAEDGPGVGVFALPLDCGIAPYPIPTGSDVTSSVVFSNYVITQNGVPHNSGPITLSSPNEVLTLSFDWIATGSVSAGQYFDFSGPLDSNGLKVFTSATQWFPVLNNALTAQAGCASVVSGDINVQFTNYVDGRSGVGGRISLYVQMESGSAEETTTIDFSFDDDSTFSISIPGTPTDSFGKRGWFMRDDQGIVDSIASIRWTIHVPANPQGYTNLVLSDYAPVDDSWTFSCAGPSASTTVVVASGLHGPVSIPFTEACDADVMTLTVASVPANTNVDFYFYADITPQSEGPFYNVATASADNVERIDLPYEVRRTIGNGIADGNFVVAPIPPAIDHAACVDEVNDTWRPASVTLPQQDGITYTMSPDPFPENGGHLVVVASLDEGYVWAAGADSNGWVWDETNNTMVYETDVTNDPCIVETETPTPTTTPPVTITPTPDYPCIPPTPEVCEPTPTPPGENPPGEGTPTPPPCEPGPTPTVPAWCLYTPTPPTVEELPKTGGDQAGNSSTLIAAGMLAATVVAAAGAITYRERTR